VAQYAPVVQHTVYPVGQQNWVVVVQRLGVEAGHTYPSDVAVGHVVAVVQGSLGQ
jgi:hypothetical protein